jgi:hypothetical protein
MLYYCAAVNLIMEQNIDHLFAKFTTRLEKEPNVMTVIYSRQYNPEPLYKEYLYAVLLHSNKFAILYEDRYCQGKIFLYFLFDEESNKLKFDSFGEETFELYDKSDNFFIKQILNQSGAALFGIKQPLDYQEYNSFFKKVFNNHWLNQMYMGRDVCNIVFRYLECYKLL